MAFSTVLPIVAFVVTAVRGDDRSASTRSLLGGAAAANPVL
jgi:hypothetical protein